MVVVVMRGLVPYTMMTLGSGVAVVALRLSVGRGLPSPAFAQALGAVLTRSICRRVWGGREL